MRVAGQVMNLKTDRHMFAVIAIDGMYDMYKIKQIYEYWYNTKTDPASHLRDSKLQNWYCEATSLTQMANNNPKRTKHKKMGT